MTDFNPIKAYDLNETADPANLAATGPLGEMATMAKTLKTLIDAPVQRLELKKRESHLNGEGLNWHRLVANLSRGDVCLWLSGIPSATEMRV